MGPSLLTSVCLFSVWHGATCPQTHTNVVVSDDWNWDESEERRGLFSLMDRGELRGGRGKMDGRVADVFWQMLLPLLKKKEKWLPWSSAVSWPSAGKLVPGLKVHEMVSVIRWWKVTCGRILSWPCCLPTLFRLLCQSQPPSFASSFTSFLNCVFSACFSSRLWSSHSFPSHVWGPFQGG